MIDPRTTLVLIRAARSGAWENKTAEIASVDVHGSKVDVRFVGADKVYGYGADRIRVLDDPVTVPVPPGGRLRVRGALWRRRDASDLEVREFGHPPDAWRTISYRTGRTEKHLSYRADDVRVVRDASGDGAARDVMSYWRRIVASRALPEGGHQRQDPIVGAYRSLQHVDPDSVLAAYLNREAPARRSAPEALVLPFACNLSQRDAVRQGLSHALSVIEGPPGTGKTQTILNLVANIVTADIGSVGVVSFSNSAVDNVDDKLKAHGFGHIVAQLGHHEKLQAFLAAQDARQALADEVLRTAPAQPPSPSELSDASRRLTRALEAERRRAELRGRIDAYALERRHFERHRHAGTAPDLGDLPLLRRSAARILGFLAETQIDQEAGRPGLLRRIQRYLRYGPSRGLDPADSDVVLALQAAFYERRIAELEQRLAAVERSRAADDVDALTRAHRELSERAFAAAVASRHRDVQPPLPDGRLPSDDAGFNRFCRSYPVILSTCHSLRKHLPDGYLLDYLIIDEASQVDLLTASLAMASCRNLVVVGDRRQLPHIPGGIPNDAIAPAPAYDCEQHSLLSSVTELYGDDLPTTLLREHYRSHPAIIGFCNSAFYGGELIPYTEPDGRPEPAMWVHTTAAGNHMRTHHGGGRSNQREIDVIEREVLDRAPAGIEARDVAVAAPYRLQADKAADSLTEAADTIDTVYKLQGRERRMLILTTVLSETGAGRRGLRFVDDPRLVNVAVSRATDHFVLVTNHQKLASSRHLRDLIGYIEYRYPDDQPEASRVVSVFDLLYREYDDVLRPLAKRLSGGPGSPAEQIIEAVLDGVLSEPEHAHLRAESQMLLRNLVPAPDTLGDAQRAFVQRRSSVDFVLYNRITRRPTLAIEVDGFRFHEDRPEQLRRDALKDGILARVGIPLLRLATTGSDEERRIREALTNAELAHVQRPLDRG
ncbi:MAG: AAA domain-containing protein [Solirubrobacteraceae bacterium]|nr:AAA domain-containing protein [Solirubrobacteraceae bacterium]